MFGSCPLEHKHCVGLLSSGTWLGGHIHWLGLLLSVIVSPGQIHWSELLKSRTKFPGQTHSPGLLALRTWLPGQPKNKIIPSHLLPTILWNFYEIIYLNHRIFHTFLSIFSILSSFCIFSSFSTFCTSLYFFCLHICDYWPSSILMKNNKILQLKYRCFIIGFFKTIQPFTK